MSKILFQEESFQIVGILFDVYNNLGNGFSEIVYKDALEFEFRTLDIPFQREREYAVSYKNTVLKHKFYADFVVHDKIILEIKSCESISDTHISQCLNYLKVSNNRLAILANFTKEGVEYKRIVL
ncbi:MAG: GxxExxY protein [Bacteroidota bacterium]